MAKKFTTITNIKLFRNDNGAATHGNSKWTPYKDGGPGDLTFRGDQEYSVKLFDNGDGSLGLNISMVTEDGEQGGGMQSLGQATASVAKPSISMDDLDDDIPF